MRELTMITKKKSRLLRDRVVNLRQQFIVSATLLIVK
jgi:hypothetical protein